MIKKKINFTVFICTILLLGLVYYIANSMLWTGTSATDTKPALGSSFSIKDLVTNRTLSLNSEDVNSLVKLYAPKLENTSCSIKDSKITFYVPVNYHGLNLLLSTRGKLEYVDSVICYSPDCFKVGKLTVPKSLAFSYIKKYAAVNSEKKRIEIESSKLPIQIESLELKDDVLQIKLGKIGASSALPAPSSPSAKKPAPSSNNTSSDLLKRTSTQLDTVYSKVKTTSEKQIIQQIQDTVDKMIKISSYNYKNDAAAVKLKYSKLTTAEKNDLKDAIIMNMDIDTLLKLKDTFGL